MNKYVFLFSLMFTVVGAFCQQFKLGEKISSNGYMVIYMDYKDSVNFNKNSVGYYFIEDKDFSNSKLSELYGDFKSNSTNGVYPYLNGVELKIPTGRIRMAAFTHYLDYYYELLNDSMKNANKEFASEIGNTISRLEGNYSDGIWQVFKSPYLRSKKDFGYFYSISKITMNFYIANYNSFEDYEVDFLSSSNDLRKAKLVGLQGTSLGAKLKKISKGKGKYPVVLPINVVIR